MPRKGENIYKRKDGRWEGRYIKARTPAGKAVYGYVYAKSYREVKQKRSLASVKVPSMPGKQIPAASLTFGQLAQQWLSCIQSQIKESSYIKYRNLLYSYILPSFSNTMPDEIRACQLQSFCEHLLISGGKSKKGLSPKTVSDILSVIRSIFQYAQTQGISVSCTGQEVIVRQSSSDMAVLSVQEQEKLCEYLYLHLSEKALGILLCLFTGLRLGEICALRWEDLSFSEKTVHVHQTMQRLQSDTFSGKKTSVTITSPKSKCSIRTIPLPETMLQLICREFPNRHGFLLTGEENRYVEPRSMQNYFKRIQTASGIRPVNFHVLRHTFATRCVEVGFDVKSLSEILGHASVNITMNRYVHPSMELKQQNMQRLSGLFTVR